MSTQFTDAAYRLAQEFDVLHKQRAITVKQVDHEEIRAARNAVATIIRHAKTGSCAPGWWNAKRIPPYHCSLAQGAFPKFLLNFGQRTRPRLVGMDSYINLVVQPY
jgi:hypothetical protein